MIVASTAILSDRTMESSQTPSAERNFRYHWSEKPSIGKERISAESKEAITTTTRGVSKKI
ncbi:MAG: hypothetical protein CM1200mP20_10480 [Pseudomonadota bacterium]|nr:MAG: hypothetical protein CM1200mP20_10480 [Pseudomonadota bacterium]